MHKAPIAQLGNYRARGRGSTDLPASAHGPEFPLFDSEPRVVLFAKSHFVPRACPICRAAARSGQLRESVRIITYPLYAASPMTSAGILGIIGLFPMIYIAIGFTLLIRP